MQAKVDEFVKSYTATFVAWKLKWIEYHNEYLEKYEAIIKERHAFIYRMKYSYFVCQ